MSAAGAVARSSITDGLSVAHASGRDFARAGDFARGVANADQRGDAGFWTWSREGATEFTTSSRGVVNADQAPRTAAVRP